jgi:methylthioribulose-1-phosphate dehydratase
MFSSFDEAANAICATGRRLAALGLASATSGNYSARLADGGIAITVSGQPKGRLRPEDVMLLAAPGSRKPSAEAQLHVALYRLYPRIHAVLHVHSVAAVALTRYRAAATELVLEGYEMLKAFPGVSTHATSLTVPVFENSQDLAAMAQCVAQRLQAAGAASAFLIRGHGAYGWGKDLDESERIIEALEHLLLCELETLRLPAYKS